MIPCGSGGDGAISAVQISYKTSTTELRYIKEAGTDFPVQRSFRALSVSWLDKSVVVAVSSWEHIGLQFGIIQWH